MQQSSECPQLDALVTRHGELRRAGELGRQMAEATISDFARKMAHARCIAEEISKLEAAGKWPPSAKPNGQRAPMIDVAVFNRPLRLTIKP